MWFERLVGFPESAKHVRDNLRIDGRTLTSRANGRSLTWGELETPSLGELRERVRLSGTSPGRLSIREVVANVQDLHRGTENAGALFQVASQFNLLEMVNENISPEHGIDRYEGDRTQGPACAIAAGAGTIYRNYFANVDGQIGQTKDRQIDCLADLGRELGNKNGQLWTMSNGYALPSRQGLEKVSALLEHANESQLDDLRARLRIGIQWETQVTLDRSEHLVSQAYCSAMPVGYTDHPASLWAPFATLILEASYEATLLAAALNAERTGNKTVFLTLLGGGVFGNDPQWILGAIERAHATCFDQDLDVAVVSFGRSNRELKTLIGRLNKTASGSRAEMGITERTSLNSPLGIAEVACRGGAGMIGVTLCPGKKQRDPASGIPWNRDVDLDLDVIKKWGASAVVSLIEDHEFELLQVRGLGTGIKQRGIEWHHLPIADSYVPTEDWERRWLRVGPELQKLLAGGRKVLVHCKGGLGRAGTVAARLLIDQDLSAQEAIDRVRARRPGAIENREQEDYLRRWACRNGGTS